MMKSPFIAFLLAIFPPQSACINISRYIRSSRFAFSLALNKFLTISNRNKFLLPSLNRNFALILSSKGKNI